MLHEGLEDVLPYIVDPGTEDKADEKVANNNKGEISDEDEFDEDEESEIKMSLDELVSGALESTFWAMDRSGGGEGLSDGELLNVFSFSRTRLILRDKEKYRISGGCTALVALFICDKLFVANAGDSRAALYLEGESVRPMSTDFNPSNDRQRIQHIAFHRPELLRHPHTKEKLFNR